MLFGTKLDHELYDPWKQYYINYNHLKKLLKEGVILKNNWTDKDEQNFVSALDENLEKVYTFQHQKFDELNDQLNDLQLQTETSGADFNVESFSSKLDRILDEAQELEHFQRINYTGFIKIVKKHDRLHSNYSVKPLLNVRLKSLPFHSEDYSPLLYKVGTLFQFLRENYDVDQALSKLSSFNDSGLNAEFQSFKFWIHPENLMEVKTTILRHLPVLIYNSENVSQIDDDDDDDEEEDEAINDQTINALYFDNNHFELYNNKLTKINNSSTLRIKWIGKLADKPKIVMEKKQFDSNSNFNVDDKITLKQKYINQFVINKELPSKLKKINDESSLNHILGFINEFNLQPILRTTYKRTAFQIPGDDKIRIVIDTNLNFIREDSFDSQLPIRDPSSWHRTDIDSNTANPQQFLRKGEYIKFPYSTMEIKIKKSAAKNFKKLNWINELINSSNLIKEIPNFSKFIHGVASLFLEDDKLDNIPLWFNELENDISSTSHYVPKSKRTLQQQENDIQNLTDADNLSKFKSMILKNQSSSFQPRSSSFSGSMLLNINKDEEESIDHSVGPSSSHVQTIEEEAPQSGLTDDQSSEFDDDDDDDLPGSRANPISKILNLPVQFSKLLDVDSEDEEVDLPLGVSKPESWIKNAGPLKIEPKVWLANERTFNRWLHVTTLLSTLTFVIYSSTMNSNFAGLSTILAYFYFALTLFSGIWGYYIFMRRRTIIMERSDKHLDNSIGPLIVAFGLILALVVNFVFGWKGLKVDLDDEFYANNTVHRAIHEYVINLVN
ncbi:Phosphate metabolism transcription protein [Scheffersomyces stipitis CBS 6054]|uniref:Phosphate metabolism transcription protein n=1 Tax=Scheffersomyces stipitis (strain ATCC 58785 / CBS 6054 / NBRC 10063 / NRRL Y-11545) TaxID=322104 RepID=A3M0E1_PICST|nr:Phosphate metabolism transcription protein [Scheffersomyces stipitis CBS 6054]ABN68507.2 Phosphate metabolism transcription protein [Scheffersomyces stipitis CBS 6054]